MSWLTVSDSHQYTMLSTPLPHHLLLTPLPHHLCLATSASPPLPRHLCLTPLPRHLGIYSANTALVQAAPTKFRSNDIPFQFRYVYTFFLSTGDVNCILCGSCRQVIDKSGVKKVWSSSWTVERPSHPENICCNTTCLESIRSNRLRATWWTTACGPRGG
jgi:hypothetical protein